MNNNVKSATTAGLLGIFLGSFGAHDWYLGNKSKGILHVSLVAAGFVLMLLPNVLLPAVMSWRSLVTFGWLFVLLNALASIVMFANAVWGFIEGVIILSQGDAGLARKGYAVANNNFGQNGFNNNFNNGNNFNQPMNNMNGGYNNGNQGNVQQNGDNNVQQNVAQQSQNGTQQGDGQQNGAQSNSEMSQSQAGGQTETTQNETAQNGAGEENGK